MTGQAIGCVDASGDAFTVGHALGQACAADITSCVFPTEEFRALVIRRPVREGRKVKKVRMDF